MRDVPTTAVTSTSQWHLFGVCCLVCTGVALGVGYAVGVSQVPEPRPAAAPPPPPGAQPRALGMRLPGVPVAGSVPRMEQAPSPLPIDELGPTGAEPASSSGPRNLERSVAVPARDTAPPSRPTS